MIITILVGVGALIVMGILAAVLTTSWVETDKF